MLEFEITYWLVIAAQFIMILILLVHYGWEIAKLKEQVRNLLRQRKESKSKEPIVINLGSLKETDVKRDKSGSK